MRYDLAALRSTIFKALPPGLVVSEHTADSHFYRVMEGDNPVYPSVTAKLQIIKDEGLANFKMNRALEYIFGNFKSFTDANIMEHIARAEQMPADIFVDAGDVGTRIHDIRQDIFDNWIETGVRPADFASFIPPHDPDIRVASAIAALDTFCTEKRYIPVATELKVYSHRFKVAGTLDDLGLMCEEVRKGDIADCDHMSGGLMGTRESTIVPHETKNFDCCMRCNMKWKWIFVLLDVKTSNRFKDSYFVQVAMYYDFLRKLTGLKPDCAFILKLSKTDRTYKIEDLKRPAKIAQYVKDVIRINEGLEFIKSLRKDNQRNVLKI